MSGKFSAPGVYRKEIDLSEILIPVGVSNGGTIVRAKRGPIRRPVLVTNDKEYLEIFGQPIFTSGQGTTSPDKLVPEYGYGSYGALQFLQESDTLFVVRAYDENDKYANVEFDGNVSAYPASEGVSADQEVPEVFDSRDNISAYEEESVTKALRIGYVGPGEDGNNYAVTIETLNPGADWLFRYDDEPTEISASELPSSASDSSIWNSNTGGSTSAVEEYFPIASSVVKISVYEKPSDKEWEDLAVELESLSADVIRRDPLEVWYGSLDETAKDPNNANIFIEHVINGNSRYIYVNKGTGSFSLSADNSSWNFDSGEWEDDENGNIDFGYYRPDNEDDAGYYVNYDSLGILSGGASATTAPMDATDSNFWKYFENREELPVSILVNTYFNGTHKREVGKLVAKRRDCMVASPVAPVGTLNFKDVLSAEKFGYTSPSYVALYSGYSKIYDQFNDKNVMIPNSIFGAVLMARADVSGGPWMAPAGATRGILGVGDQNKVYSVDHIGRLYDKNINSVRLLPQGFVMWGQKTAQLKTTALDRINVRRALIYISVNIERALNDFLFENNTPQTRLRVSSLIEEFLVGVRAADGLTDFDVVCDESNNPPSVIDANQLNVDIYVQPVQTIEFIQFTTVITRTGVSFGEVRLKYQ